jgi:hypothetical protein
LTVLERAVVEWRASGVTAAEAYRRATGKDSDAARQGAYQILTRPRVAAALKSLLNDRNVGARVDREWVFQKLYSTISQCEDMHTPAGMWVIVSALNLVSRLQGEIGPDRAAQPTAERSAARANVAKQIEEIIAESQRYIAGVKDRGATAAATVPAVVAQPVTPTPSQRLDQLVAEAESSAAQPRPRPAVEGPPAVAPPAISAKAATAKQAEPGVVTRPPTALPAISPSTVPAAGMVTRKPQPAPPASPRPAVVEAGERVVFDARSSRYKYNSATTIYGLWPS